MLYARLLPPKLKPLRRRIPGMSRTISLRSLVKETRVPIPAALEVKLTPEEDNLFKLLDECRQELKKKGNDVECRVAGGWVRDKLLGTQSNDIDIALSSMMGTTFAEHFVSFVSSKNLPVKSVSTIFRNPEQSKHLETARTTVLGVELDFVNLRSESYAEDSRIPTEVKIGTPLEDALRRDITMNALFYNVHTRSVEDWTEKGLEDLRNGILRTPLAPFETFKDDPLRVIRCIRFASRFGFKMVKEIEDAMQDAEIQAAIISKISRERVGDELDKMMKGKNPLHSINLITSLHLQQPLFSVAQTVSSTFSPSPSPPTASLAASVILHAFINSSLTPPLPALHPRLVSQLSEDRTLRPRLYLATALTPYRHVTYMTPKKKTLPAVEIVIREALKLGLQNHYADGVPALFASADVLEGLSVDNFTGPNVRSKIGLLLKSKSIHNSIVGAHWSSSLLFSLVQELAPLWDVERDKFEWDKASKIVERYNLFLERVEELNLPGSIDDKPILNGNEIVDILGATKPGAWTGVVLSKITEWALDHPSGTKEECATWLKDELAAGRILISTSGTDKHRTRQSEQPLKRAKVG